MRQSFWLLSLALALLVTNTPAAAHDSEPINTEFAAPFALKSGSVQIAFQYFRGGESYDAVPLEFEYGFAPRMQFSVGLPMTRRDAPGATWIRPGNLELGYRYLLAGANERRFALSVNPHVVLPTGDKRAADRAWELGAALHLDTHLAPRFWTHTNLGYETPVAHFAEKEKNFVYKFAAMYELSHRFQPVLELVGMYDFHRHQRRMAVVPELIFAPSHHWEIKTGVPLGATQATPDVGVQFQLTWKFGEGRD